MQGLVFLNFLNFTDELPSEDNLNSSCEVFLNQYCANDEKEVFDFMCDNCEEWLQIKYDDISAEILCPRCKCHISLIREFI